MRLLQIRKNNYHSQSIAVVYKAFKNQNNFRNSKQIDVLLDPIYSHFHPDSSGRKWKGQSQGNHKLL